jgi:hypothetical protein
MSNKTKVKVKFIIEKQEGETNTEAIDRLMDLVDSAISGEEGITYDMNYKNAEEEEDY